MKLANVYLTHTLSSALCFFSAFCAILFIEAIPFCDWFVSTYHFTTVRGQLILFLDHIIVHYTVCGFSKKYLPLPLYNISCLLYNQVEISVASGQTGAAAGGNLIW
jgi:hypothetical protein